MTYVIYTPKEAMQEALNADLERLTIKEEVERGALVDDWLAPNAPDADVVVGRFRIDAEHKECELLAARLRAHREKSLMVAIWSQKTNDRPLIEILGIPSVESQASAKSVAKALLDQRYSSSGVTSAWQGNRDWKG